MASDRIRAELPARYTIVPVVAHHQHLLGPTYLALWRAEPLPSIQLPPEFERVLDERQTLMGSAATADIYTQRARLLVQETWLEGPDAIRRWWNQWQVPQGNVRYVLPQAYEMGDSTGYIAGTLVMHPADSTTRYARRLMYVLMVVEKGTDGKWRISAESGTNLNPPEQVTPVTAAQLVNQMNEAGIARGVVLSLAYMLARAPAEVPGERDLVRAENDWTVAQAAAFPGRLIVFCSVNPLRDYSVEEMDRCSEMALVRGIKLHFGNSVDLMNGEHVARLRDFFRAANERRIPLVVHLSMNAAYRPEHARNFLTDVLPSAPDITIQIAHMGSGGPYALGVPDEALKVFADAIAAGNPATKNLYFDATGSVAFSPPAAALDSLAHRMRTIGLHRVVFGSDLPFPPPLSPVGPAWATFRRIMPLTDDELRVIANNIAPYAR